MRMEIIICVSQLKILKGGSREVMQHFKLVKLNCVFCVNIFLYLLSFSLKL